MPLYRCERCGWATTAFRVDAVRDHHTDCPECAGALRMVFHIGNSRVEPDPVPEDLKAERDRARKEYDRRIARERGQRRGRLRRAYGPDASPRRNSPH
jgi:hypothetical protein